MNALVPVDEKMVEKIVWLPRKDVLETTGRKDSGVKKQENHHLVDIECYI